MKTYLPTESQIQAAFVEYVKVKNPLLSPLLIKITNEGKRSLSLGAKMKREGLQKGVPDLFFAKPTQLYCGLWIEVKTPGKRPTEEQFIYLDRLNNEGYSAFWSDDLDDIIIHFENYLQGTMYEQGRDRKSTESALSENRTYIQEDRTSDGKFACKNNGSRDDVL